MSKYRKIFHHISSKDVRKKHQDNIAQLRIKEEREIKILDHTESAMKVVKYDWRSDKDLGAELREGMTTANVYQKLGDTSEDGELETQVIDTSLEGSFEDSPVNGLENMMFKGVSIKDGGTGSGDNGGFDIGKHLAFSANTNSDGSSYSDGGSRHALLAPIDARNIDTITITAIRGNDQNGGELPDATDEDLRLMWFNPDPNGTNGVGDWMDIDFESVSPLTRNNDVNPIIIPRISGGEGSSEASEFPALRDWTITIPDYCKNENQRFALYQQTHSGRQYDHYGITQIKYRARTPTNAFVALDKPEASSFVRFGTNEGDPKKRKKKLEDQLKASKEYTDTVLGTDFPGGSATLSEPESSPIGYEQLSKTHIQAGTLAQQLKKALGKETDTQSTTSNNTLQAIKSAAKLEAIKQKKEETKIINTLESEELDETTLKSVFDSETKVVSKALQSARKPSYSYQKGDTALYGYDLSSNAWKTREVLNKRTGSYEVRQGLGGTYWMPPGVDGSYSGGGIDGLRYNVLKPNEIWTTKTNEHTGRTWVEKETVTIDNWWPKEQIEKILGEKLFFRATEPIKGDPGFDKTENNAYQVYKVDKNKYYDHQDSEYYLTPSKYNLANRNGTLVFHDRWDSDDIGNNYLDRFADYKGQGKYEYTTSDGKHPWYSSDPEAKEIAARYWEVSNEFSEKSNALENELREKRKVPIGIFNEKKALLEPLVKEHNLERKEIQKDEEAYKELAEYNMKKAHGRLLYTSCSWGQTNCKTMTRDDGTTYRVGPPKVHGRDKIVKGRGNTEYIIYKKGDPIYHLSYGKDSHWSIKSQKWVEVDNMPFWTKLNLDIEKWKEKNYGPWYEKYNNLSQYAANITLEMEKALWDLNMQNFIDKAQLLADMKEVMNNDPLSDSYIGDLDPEDPDENTGEVSEEDEKWLNDWETRTKFLGFLEKMNISLDFARMAIQYARGDNTPWKKFDPVLERQTLSVVEREFKKALAAGRDPNSLQLSYKHWGLGSTGTLSLGTFTAHKTDLEGNRLPEGTYRIEDTFDVNKVFTSVGQWGAVIPGLQGMADRIVRIAHQRRGIDPKDPGYEGGGIPIMITIGKPFGLKSVYKKRRQALSVDEPIVRSVSSTPKSKKKRKKSNYIKSKVSESRKENSFDKIRRVSRDYDYDKIKIVEEPIVSKPKVKVVQEIEKRSDWRTELKESDWTPVSSGRPTMSTSQTFQHASGATATFNALSGPDAHPNTINITAYGDTFPVDAPTINEIPLQGHASPIDGWKMARKNNEKKAKETNVQLSSAKKATKMASGASEFMDARVTEEDEVKDKMALIKKRLKELDTWKKDVVKAQNDHYDKYQNTIQEKILDPINNIISKYNLDTYSTFTGSGGHNYKVVDNPDAGKTGQPPQVLVSLSVNGLNAKYSSKTNVRIYWPTQKNGAWQPLSIEDISGKGIKVNRSFGSKFSNNKSKGVKDATVMIKNLGNVVLDEDQTAPEYTKFELPKAPPNLQRNLDAGWKPLGHEFDYNREPIEKEFIKAMKNSPLFSFANILGSGSDAAGRMMIKQLELDFSTWDKSPGEGFDKRVLVLINRALDRNMPIGEVQNSIYSNVNGFDEAKDFPVRAALQSINYEVTDNGIRIIDTFDFDGNTSLGFGAEYPGLQRNADQMVTIAARQAAELGWDMKTTVYGRGQTIKPGIDWDRTVKKHSVLPNAKSGLPDKMVFDPGGNEEARMKAWLQLPEDEKRHLMMVNYYNYKEMVGPHGQGKSGPHGIPWPIPVLSDRTTPEGFDFKVDYTIPWSQVSPELRSRLSGKQTTKSTTPKGRLDAYGGVDKIYDKKKTNK